MLIYVAYLTQESLVAPSITRQVRFITTDKQIANSIGFYMNQIKVESYEPNQKPSGKKLTLDDVQFMLNCSYDKALSIYTKLQQKVVVNEFELAQFDYNLESYFSSLLDSKGDSYD